METTPRKVEDAVGNTVGWWDEETQSWVSAPSDAQPEPDEDESVDLEAHTKDELKQILDDAETEYPSNATKDQLIALVKALP